MALCWGFIVGLLAINAGFSEAQNHTTSSATVIATPTTVTAVTTSSSGGGEAEATQIAPTPTASVHPASTSASPSSPRYSTYMRIDFKASPCASGEASFNTTFRRYFADAKFDFQNVMYTVTRETCQFSFNFTFGPKLRRYDVIDVFQKELKKSENTIGGMKLTDVKIEVRVNGVVLNKFDDLEKRCKEKCCGTGGPITLNITCKPSDTCGSYKFTKTVEKCMDECVCSGVVYKISLLVLLCSVFMNWFLK